MLWKIIIIYISITALNFIINFYRACHTSFLSVTYRENIENKCNAKNFELLQPIEHIFRKANVYFEQDLRQGLIYNVNPELEVAFDEALYHYKYLMKHCFSWFLRIPIPSLSFVQSKTTNKIIQLIYFVLSSFAIYLLGLYLDDSGLGLKILDFLSDFLKKLF